MNDAEDAERDQVSLPVTSPSPAGDPLTRLWAAADASQGHHNEVVAELRERKRREREAPRRVRRRLRNGRRGVSDPAVATKQPTDVAVDDARVECERCRRSVARASSERVEIPPPVGESAAYLLCSRCADEVRRGLLRLLAGQDPLPAPTHEAREVPPTTLARAGWFVLRIGAYGLIALAVFVVVSWFSGR